MRWSARRAGRGHLRPLGGGRPESGPIRRRRLDKAAHFSELVLSLALRKISIAIRTKNGIGINCLPYIEFASLGQRNAVAVRRGDNLVVFSGSALGDACDSPGGLMLGFEHNLTFAKNLIDLSVPF